MRKNMKSTHIQILSSKLQTPIFVENQRSDAPFWCLRGKPTNEKKLRIMLIGA